MRFQHLITAAGRSLAAAAVLFAAAGSAVASAPFPSMPIKLVVPVGTGTGSDLAARHLAVGLGKMLNATVIVENKAGAAGVIGTEAVARAEPDGHTLLLTFSAHYINQWVMKTSFDAVRDFEPVAALNTTALVLVTGANSPYKSVADVVAAAKNKPKGLSFASAGAGGVTHMAGALLNSMAGIELNHVPYKTASQVPIDASTGVVDLAFVGVTAGLPLLQAGRLRALAVTPATRSRHLPDTPTLAESGIAGYELASRIYVLAPRGTPPEVVSKLSDAFTRLGASDEFKEFCRLQGCDVEVRSGAAVKAAAPAELTKWKRLVDLSNPKAN